MNRTPGYDIIDVTSVLIIFASPLQLPAEKLIGYRNDLTSIRDS